MQATEPLHINPDTSPAYQDLINTLFALNTVAMPQLYTVRVYGLGVVELRLDDRAEATGTIDEVLKFMTNLYSDAVPTTPRH